MTYLSEDGAYGGPVAVAVGQTRQLAENGDEVTLLAGWDGSATLDLEEVDVVLCKTHQLLRSLKFASMASPGTIWYFLRNMNRFDIVHVHLSRDLVTIPIALLAVLLRRKLFIQTHGMIRSDNRLLSRILDATATRRIMRSSIRHYVLTEHEKADVRTVEAHRDNITFLRNGIKPSSLRAQWSEPAHVIFCARLHPRKRVMHFVEAAEISLDSGLRADFEIVGPDAGDLTDLLSYLDRSRHYGKITYEGAITQGSAVNRFRRCQLMVLPSVEEPYPMSVLEALSVGCPSIITSSNGLAGLVRSTMPAQVCAPDPLAIAEAIRASLVSKHQWERLSDLAYHLASNELGIESVVRKIHNDYSATIS